MPGYRETPLPTGSQRYEIYGRCSRYLALADGPSNALKTHRPVAAYVSRSPDTVAMFAYDLPSLALWATISIAVIDRRVNNHGEG